MQRPKTEFYNYWLISLTAMATVFIVLLSDSRYDVLAMLKLEFAQTQDYFFDVQQHYDYPDSLLELYLYFDFAFIASFSLLFCYSIGMLLQMRMTRLHPGWVLFGMVPGLLDVAENLIMFAMLRNDGVSADLFNSFRIIVMAKWAVVLPCAGAALLILLFPVSSRVREFIQQNQR